MRRYSKREYPEKNHVFALVKYGYSEWLEIQPIIKNQKGIQAHELKISFILMINKVRNLNLVPLPDASLVLTVPFSTRSGRRSKHSRYLLPYGTVYTNNTLPADVVCVQDPCITEPERGLFFVNNEDHMCFQRFVDLHTAPTEHIFHHILE